MSVRRRTMGYDVAIPWRRRAGALSAIVALHIIALVALLVIRSAAPVPIEKPGSISVMSLSAETTPPAASPPPATLSQLLDQLQPPSAILAPPAESAATAVSDSGCVTLEIVGKALIEDPAAVASVLNSPMDTRSISEAIIIWNAGWSEGAAFADSPLAPARSALELSLIDIPEDCLDEQVAGPRLVPIPTGGEGTMFVVIGSGLWRWRDLTREAQVEDRPFGWFGELFEAQ